MLTNAVRYSVHDSTRLVSDLGLRELEVLALLGEGMTDLAIAGALSISRRTVGSHMRSIRQKLRVSSMDLMPSARSREGLDMAPASEYWSCS
jgi:DNA-binding CsgD family transcriptional regulator